MDEDRDSSLRFGINYIAGIEQKSEAASYFADF